MSEVGTTLPEERNDVPQLEGHKPQIPTEAELMLRGIQNPLVLEISPLKVAFFALSPVRLHAHGFLLRSSKAFGNVRR
jgi:hypothetical protein